MKTFKKELEEIIETVQPGFSCLEQILKDAGKESENSKKEKSQ